MILRWKDGRYYPVEHGVKVAEREKPLGDETPSHREIIRRIKSLISDGLQMNGSKLRFGMHGDGRYNPYLDLTATPHMEAGLSVSPSRLRNGNIVILVGQDRSIMPGHVNIQGRKATIELPWEEKSGKRFFVLDEGGNGLITVTLETNGGDKVKAISSVGVGSWLSSECPLATPQYTLAGNGSMIKCPDGRFLETDDGKTFSEEDLATLNRAGLARLLGKYRLRRARQCQG